MPNLSNAAADRGKPKILVSDDDLLRLTRLAEAASRHSPDIAETLLSELERAGVVPPEAMPDNVIRMGSTVEYRPDDGEPRRVLLVFPGEADIAMNRISILTPIGTALLGLSPGQSIEWTARDQRVHRLAILSVDNTALSERQASA
jgi:regulator of nucleoside diphosphate kinase